jgi:hypothetical protein
MASASSLAHFNSSRSDERGLETIEIDPQYSQGLGFSHGDVVRCDSIFILEQSLRWPDLP